MGTNTAGDFVEIEEPCQLLWANDQLLALGNDSKNVVGWNRDGDLSFSMGGRGTMGAGHGFTMDSDGRMVVAISPLHPWSGYYNFGIPTRVKNWRILPHMVNCWKELALPFTARTRCWWPIGLGGKSCPMSTVGECINVGRRTNWALVDRFR